MKRTFYVAAGALVLGVVVFFCARGWAQTPGTTPPATATASNAKSKVAMFNLTYVLKHYQKFSAFETDLKATMKGYQTKEADMKKQGEDLAKALQNTKLTGEQREKIEKDIKALQRKMEDNRVEGSKVIMKKQGEQLKILYMEVRTAVARYAASHGYDVVMHYNDAITNDLYFSNENIARKMGAGALMPIYMGHGVDISMDLVRNLNAAYKR